MRERYPSLVKFDQRRILRSRRLTSLLWIEWHYPQSFKIRVCSSGTRHWTFSKIPNQSSSTKSESVWKSSINRNQPVLRLIGTKTALDSSCLRNINWLLIWITILFAIRLERYISRKSVHFWSRILLRTHWRTSSRSHRYLWPYTPPHLCLSYMICQSQSITNRSSRSFPIDPLRAFRIHVFEIWRKNPCSTAFEQFTYLVSDSVSRHPVSPAESIYHPDDVAFTAGLIKNHSSGILSKVGTSTNPTNYIYIQVHSHHRLHKYSTHN